MAFTRPMTTSSRMMAGPGKAERHEGTEQYRKDQIEKSLNPHMTNTNSTITNNMPSAGAGDVPPEFISSADSNFNPKDSVPENTERMTGGTQNGAPEEGEMDVGEMQGGTFKIEPLRRTGEDANTTRARLLCSYIVLWNSAQLTPQT